MTDQSRKEVAQYDFQGNAIRIVCEQDGTPMFCGKDVASALGYKDTTNALKQHCKGVAIHHPLQTAGGIQQVRFIAEGDLYRLIANSKLPDAEKFERWVFDDVLPSIRKHGGYLTPAKLEDALLNPDTLIQLATQLKEERARRAELEVHNKALTPKATAWETLCGAHGDMSVADAAKALASRAGLDIGRDRLFEQMGKFGWLTRCHGYWEPLQYAVERGYVATRVNMPRWKATGESFIPRPTVRVTAKGLDRLFSRLAGDGVVC